MCEFEPIDQQVNTTTSAFVRFSHRKLDNFEPPPIDGQTSSPANAYVDVLNQQYAGGVTKTLSSRSLLEIRVGVNRTEAGKTAFGTGEPNMLEAYGITGLPTDAVFSGGLTEQSVGGWTSWGRQNSNPQYQNPFVVDTRVNYSWIAGAHTLKTGYEYQRINTEVDDVNPKYGQDSYSGQFSRPVGGAADTATYNLADFLMGARSSYSLVNPFIIHLRQRMHFGYIQDDWRVSPRLTINLGLRYEYATPQWDANNNLTNFDPATRTLLQATDGSIYDRALVNPDKNNFGPRLGMAYSLNDKTVLRSAHGVSYVLFNRLGGENLLSFNGPHVVPVSITQQPSQGICAAGQAPSTCFRPTQMGYPEGLNVPANFNPLNGRVNHIPSDLKSGEIQSWHITVQRELGANFVVDVGYVGNKSRHLMILGDLNQARPNASGENTPLQQRRPIAGYQFIQSAFDGGRGDYNALQVKVERRYRQGVYFLNSFTWSRTRDNASGHLETANGDNSRVNLAAIESEFGTSGYDQPLNNTTTLVWELPIGRERWWGDWRVTAINMMASGLPVNLNYSPASSFQVSGVVTHRPNITGEIYADNPTAAQWFNPANIVIPTNSSQPFGNAPRNAARGPALYTLDLGVHKDLRIGAAQRVQFRIEAFNVLNKTNLGAPDSNRSNANFGSITTLAMPPRQVQLGVSSTSRVTCIS